MEPKQKDEDLNLMRKALQELGEHFDSVHIFATRHEAGTLDGTLRVNLGTGNWFARYGQIRHWLDLEQEVTRIEARHIKGEQDP